MDSTYLNFHILHKFKLKCSCNKKFWDSVTLAFFAQQSGSPSPPCIFITTSESTSRLCNFDNQLSSFKENGVEKNNLGITRPYNFTPPFVYFDKHSITFTKLYTFHSTVWTLHECMFYEAWNSKDHCFIPLFVHCITKHSIQSNTLQRDYIFTRLFDYCAALEKIQT